jgi:hypothetical protein
MGGALSPEPALESDSLRPEDVRAWAAAWLGVAGVGVLNGAIHRTYIGALGELRAHQVSGVTFIALYAPYIWLVERRRPLPSASISLAVGVSWAAAAAAFDALVGHYLAGDSWADVARDYDMSEGRIWAAVVLAIALGPAAARATRPARPRAKVTALVRDGREPPVRRRRR